MRVLRPLVAALVLALALTGCGRGDQEPDPLAPQSGGRLPDVTLPALGGGEPLALGDLRGPAVVNLWASWCGPCREELPVYEEFAKTHGDRVAVVGIDTQERSLERARALLAETGVTYPNYVDADDDVDAFALPKMVLVDGDGRIALEQFVEVTSVGQLEDLVREHLGADL